MGRRRWLGASWCGTVFVLSLATQCGAMAAEIGAGAQSGKLLVATCQFPVSADIRANSEWICRQLREAKQRNANLAHFPECALSGYPGTDFK